MHQPRSRRADPTRTSAGPGTAPGGRVRTAAGRDRAAGGDRTTGRPNRTPGSQVRTPGSPDRMTTSRAGTASSPDRTTSGPNSSPDSGEREPERATGSPARAAGGRGGALSRRGLLRAAAGGGVLASLTACAGLTPGGGTQGLRVSSYGDQTKLKLRGQVVARFNATHGGTTLVFEGTPTADYWNKLATQIAGGNAPDVVNIDAVHIAQYGATGQLAALDRYVPKILNAAVFRPDLLKQGQLHGKQYGIPLATSTYAMGYDATVLDRLGIEPPDGSWTWRDFADLAVEIHRTGGSGLYGSEDAGGDLDSLEIFLRGRGEALMDARGGPGFTADSLATWFDYWQTMRSSGGCVPADIGSQYVYGDWPNSPIVNGKAALEHIMTPNYTGGFQALTHHRLRLALPPVAAKGGRQPQYAAPSSMFALNARCREPELGAEFIDWLVSSSTAAGMLQFISGPPASSKALNALTSTKLDAADQALISYTRLAARRAFAPPPPQPQAFTQITQLLLRTNQDVSFGKQKAAAAARSVVSQSATLLKQG
jgi:multiple sugar transport system substrate-binding protein